MPFLRGSNKRSLPSSPIPKLLGTNIPPTVEEAELIRKLDNDIQEDLRRNFPNHGKPSLADTDIPAEARKLLEFARQHTRLLSSIHIFPDEILEQIFFWALLTSSDDISWLASPCRISHVCRRWHEVAISSPILWTEIGDIFIPQKPQLSRKREAQRLEQIGTRLQRSQPYPISFEFVGAVAASSSHRKAMEEILSLLVQHSARWKVVGLTVPAQLLPILEPIRRHLPLLQTLFLHFPLGDGDNPVNFDYFLHAPSLRVVTTERSRGLQSRMVLPLRQLTELRRVLFPHDQFDDGPISLIDTIMRCPNLEILVSYVSGTARIQHFACHHSLKQICIVMDGGASFLLRQLALPSLVDLRAYCFRNRHTEFAEDILQLIRNSRCHLAVLDVRSGTAWSYGVLSEILRLSHFIQHLTVDCLVPMGDFQLLLLWYPAAVMHFLQGTPRLPAIAPHLRTLRMWTDPTVYAHATAFSLLVWYRTLLSLSSPTQYLEVTLETIRPLLGQDSALERGEPYTMQLLANLNFLPMFCNSDASEQNIQRWRDMMKKQLRKPSASGFLAFHRMLKEMQALDVDHRRAKLFYRADIPYLLSKTGASFSLLGDKIFEERAAALLQKWKPELIRARNLLGDWIFRDDNTIEFVHYHDERRRSDSWITM